MLTRQEVIEELQNKVSHNRIPDIDTLKLEISCAEYEGDEPIDEYEDILLPMGYNTCDRCGDIHDSETGFFWLDGFDWEDGNPTDEAILAGLNREQEDYCAVCYPCLNALKNKGRDEKDTAEAKKHYEKYVREFDKAYGEPVCFEEFYWNDWQEMKKVLTKK